MPKHYVKQADFGKILLKMQAEKATISERFAKGASALDLASSYQLPIGAFRDACDALSIIRPAKHGRAINHDQAVFDLATTMTLLFNELGLAVPQSLEQYTTK